MLNWKLTVSTLLVCSINAHALDPQFQHLVQKAYTLQEQTMDKVNWLYIGYAPRIQDPKRIKVILSKQGFTMRVNFQMNPEEVADYPAYLKRRADDILKIWSDQKTVDIKQIGRFQSYLEQVDNIASTGMDNFDGGYYFLSRLFPDNIRKITGPDGREWVEGNFVYPITVHKTGKVFYEKDGKSTSMTPSMKRVSPPAKTYYTQDLQERRSEHWAYLEYEDGTQERSHIQDHLFNGLPAFWFKMAAGTKGAGIHGPIRYSSKTDKNGVVRNDYLNDQSLWEDIDPLYRFEVIRTANSEGCVRAEPMEMRHLFPSSPKLARQVPIHIIDEIDMFDEDMDGVGDKYIDVNYYVENHYGKQQKMDWYLKHFITYEERQKAKKDNVSIESVLERKLQRTKVFPYLHPRIVEVTSYQILGSGAALNKADPDLMRRFNQAPLK